MKIHNTSSEVGKKEQNLAIVIFKIVRDIKRKFHKAYLPNSPF